MPNWCNNSLEITGGEGKEILLAEIARIREALDTDPDATLFRSLIGTGDDYDENNPYGHNIKRYGARSDVDISEVNFTDDNSWMHFDTAWSPPQEFCRRLSEKFNVQLRLEYEEGGSDFAGFAEYDNGEEEDTCYPFLEGIYHLNKDSNDLERFFNEVEYQFEDMEEVDFEKWLASLTYLSKEHASEVREAYLKSKK